MKDLKRDELLKRISDLEQEKIAMDGVLESVVKSKSTFDNEIKERISSENFFSKVDKSMNITERRINICFDILNVSGEEYKSKVNDVNYKLANRVLENELEKIYRQQNKELEISIVGKI